MISNFICPEKSNKQTKHLLKNDWYEKVTQYIHHLAKEEGKNLNTIFQKNLKVRS